MIQVGACVARIVVPRLIVIIVCVYHDVARRRLMDCDIRCRETSSFALNEFF